MSEPAAPAFPISAMVAIIAAVLVFGVSFGLSFPLLSLLLERRGTDSLLTGLSAASSAIGLVLASPLVPRLAARFGLARLMLGCLFLSAACLLLLPVVNDVYGWFPLRFTLGIAAAGLFIGTETWLNHVAREATRGRLVGIYATALAAGFGTGPLLLPVVGFDGWPPFLLGAGLMLAAAMPVAWARRAAPRVESRSSFNALTFARFAPSLAAAVVVFGAIEGGSFALLPLYGVRAGYSEGAATVLLSMVAIGTIALQVPVGWLADRFPRYSVLAFCGAASLCGAALMPLSAGIPMAFGAVLFLWGGLSAGLYTVGLTIIGERFRGGDLTTANAAFGLLYGCGSIAGPTLGGAGIRAWDPHGYPAAMAALALAFLVILLIRRHSRAGIEGA